MQVRDRKRYGEWQQYFERALGVSPSTGYELMRVPDFPALHIGNRIVVPKEKFIQWVETNSNGGAK